MILAKRKNKSNLIMYKTAKQLVWSLVILFIISAAVHVLYIVKYAQDNNSKTIEDVTFYMSIVSLAVITGIVFYNIYVLNQKQRDLSFVKTQKRSVMETLELINSLDRDTENYYND